MNKYVYDGPVSESGRLITNRWRGETFANSEGKARSNLAYQFKRASNRPSMAKITLTGNITMVG